MDNKKKVICLNFIILIFISCKNEVKIQSDKNNLIDFKLNYCELFKNIKVDTTKVNHIFKTIIKGETYEFNVFFNDSFLINIDKVLTIGINENNRFLIDDEFVEEINCDKTILEKFNSYLLSSKDLKLFVFYNDNTSVEMRENMIKSIFNSVKNKNDSISMLKFNKPYDSISITKKREIKNEFNPYFVFMYRCFDKSSIY